ncbi:MAG: DUF523 and DUF1722 domain-containing protein [Spirochaetales bacterium]|nr:DUF523 and DUF1722 domain-containing protein [Spirochaetales bacterium]
MKIGISSCLLGNMVRFDGQHKRDAFLADNLSRWCDFVAVCPEVECGLSIPREAMRLVSKHKEDRDHPRLLTWKSGVDHTERMESWCHSKCDDLEKEDLAAFIFKSKSPSSGLSRVRVYNEKGDVVSREGQGIFARIFTERFPDLPVEDEGRLNDPGIRENFVETLFVLERWKEARREGSAAALVEFHSRHKYTFMARSQKILRLMGPLIADLGKEKREKAVEQYYPLLLEILGERKDRKNNLNVLYHMAGYFREVLDERDRRELNGIIEDYGKERLPLLVPLTMVRHFCRKYDRTYLLDQYFLNPHPLEMKLLYPV